MLKQTCCICGEDCSGKLQIEARKGTIYYFCTFHWNRYEFCTLKKLREVIRNSKNQGKPKHL